MLTTFKQSYQRNRINSWRNLLTLRIYFAFVMILLLTACSKSLLTPEQFQKKNHDHFRVVTYNINWGEREFTIIAPEKTIRAIRSSNGDLVLLQEVTSSWYHDIDTQLSKIYPYRAYKGDNDAGGLAVLSKYPITNLEYKNAKIGWHRAMFVTIRSPFGLLQAVNLHLTPPLISKKRLKFSLKAYFSTSSVRKKEIEYYIQYIRNNRPTIIAGDLNEGDNGVVRQVLNNYGFADAQNQFADYSWIWKIGPFILKRKLDHIFYNQLLEKTQSQILKDGASDHYPITVDLRKI